MEDSRVYVEINRIDGGGIMDLTRDEILLVMGWYEKFIESGNIPITLEYKLMDRFIEFVDKDMR